MHSGFSGAASASGVLRLWAWVATLEFNPYLGRQIVPMALKILDNFVLDIAGLRFHHRIQELTPHGRSAISRSGLRIQGHNARGHHGHGDLPSSCSSMLHISSAVI